MKNITTVLFDLDGTLIDTAPDMAAALDILCTEEGREPLQYQLVRPHVSNGSVALVKLAFGEDIDDIQLERLKRRYLHIYKDNIAINSRLFDEMSSVLDHIEKKGMKWGVVTNKPGWLTLPLMRALKLDHRACCIVSGDSTDNRKPHPQPMYYACDLAGSTPDECVYVGDAQRDIEAGNNAGIKTIAALYGYISELENPVDWMANVSINKPSELLSHI